jgi:hypothetical protein
MGFPGFFRERLVLCRRNHPFVDLILIRLECRLLPVSGGQVPQQLGCTVVAAIADVKGHDVPRLLVHGHPVPLLVGLLLYKAPHLIHFHVKTPYNHVTWECNRLHMQMIRQCLEAGDQKVYEPPATDTNGATDAVQGDFLAQQALHQGAMVLSHRTVAGVHHKLTTAGLVLMVLLPGMNMAIFLKVLGSTLGTRVSHDHSLAGLPCDWFVVAANHTMES